MNGKSTAWLVSFMRACRAVAAGEPGISGAAMRGFCDADERQIPDDPEEAAYLFVALALSRGEFVS